ncbi:5-hydroxytryptamine receptor 3A-like, partial [Parambassis ranga]|uniref:5-hydroxytryptamine receptor 3A-like n=1 Tax=Parambassis ranga TaxID=210632 RepID=A0A6P7ITZ2_9TELE
ILMMLLGVFILLFLSDGASSENTCSYQDVLNHLNLTKSNKLFLMSRPVKHYKEPTMVSLEVLPYAILDMVEKDQRFITSIWTSMSWQNDFISWDPQQFCGIDNVSIPADTLWKPDLTIEEITEKDKSSPSPYLTINNKGRVEVQNDQVVVSSCRMQIDKFPFDIQKCNLSFRSIIYSIKDIRLEAIDNSSEATVWARSMMRTQYEWDFIEIKVNQTIQEDQDMIIYTIIIKRKSTLYIANFLLPIIFFLFLDLSSFLISDRGGEKLSFKVTVLLAVTVMQLILNEILPASSDNIPLIAVYCIGIFGLMMLSLLQTILMMHLLARDSKESRHKKKDKNLREGCEKQSNCARDFCQWTRGVCVNDVSAGENPFELLPKVEEVRSEPHLQDGLKESDALEILSGELREVQDTLVVLLNKKKEEEEEEVKKGYWARVAKIVNRVFLIFYITFVTMFLAYLFSLWQTDE